MKRQNDRAGSRGLLFVKCSQLNQYIRQVICVYARFVSLYIIAKIITKDWRLASLVSFLVSLENVSLTSPFNLNLKLSNSIKMGRIGGSKPIWVYIFGLDRFSICVRN